MHRVHVVIGGAKSGKSLYAERLLTSWPPPYVYVATAEIRDEEMAERVERHRARRGDRWITCEEPFRITDIFATAPHRPVLVDCLTLWISNLLLAGSDVPYEVELLCEHLRRPRLAPIVLVSNEVGLGIVPENSLARRFRDLAGWTNQHVAAVASHVTWVVAGIPVLIKGEAQELRDLQGL